MVWCWIAIAAVIAVLLLLIVYACIVAGSDADKDYERWKAIMHMEDKDD